MERFLDHNTSWRKHVMEKHVCSDQTGFLSARSKLVPDDLFIEKRYLQYCGLTDLFWIIIYWCITPGGGGGGLDI